MIVGTAGHIDHGKTALVKALTGVDADRLAEEKARGITIDLGYAYTALGNGEILGFVDVPGHEKFIHNLLAGITGIDFALLVVAADDGPMPQTLEHLQILDLLGVKQGAVALSKLDRVDVGRIAEVGGQIRALLEGTALAGCPVFQVSALDGFGIDGLRAYLETTAATMGARKIRGGFRLAVDRSFSVTGAGTVVTGTVFSGQVGLGQRLMVSPVGRPVRVRGIHAQNRPAETGVAGQRCALNLADVEKLEVRRGDWVQAAELNLPTTRLDVRLKLLASEAKPLKHWTPVQVHLGAFHAAGRVALLQEGVLAPGESGWAQLVLDKPTCAVHGDLCILRDASATRTLGGGTVLDAHPPQRGRRSAQRLRILSAWERPVTAAILQGLLEATPEGLDLQAFAANANLSFAELEGLCREVRLRRVNGPQSVAFAPEHWTRLKLAVVEALLKEHENVPDSLGLNAEQLRLRTAPRLGRAAFAHVLAELLEAGQTARDGSWWHLPGYKLSLLEKDQTLWRRIAPLLLEQPFQPPRVRDIARAESLPEDAVRRLLNQAARMGWVYRIAHDHYFDRAAVAELAGFVRESAAEGLSAASFRDRIGTGRKLAIQILEYFDRVGLTRRLRDQHWLRNDSLEF